MVAMISETEDLSPNETIYKNNGVVIKSPSVAFVDRETFSTVMGSNKEFVLDDFIKLCGWGGCDSILTLSSDSAANNPGKVSDRLMWYIRFVHGRVCSGLFGTYFHRSDITRRSDGKQGADLNTESMEYKFMDECYRDRLLEPVESSISFYEILPVGDGNLLVIMENGFLHYLTQSKSTAQGFVLRCLGELDRFKTDKTGLNKLYLDLAFIDNYPLLIKARLG